AAYGVTAEEARRFGLPCGGELEVIIEPDVREADFVALLTAIAGGRIVARRWRMLIIGGSEIAHYLAEVASTVDFQVFVCDPREEYRTAWRAKGAQWM